MIKIDMWYGDKKEQATGLDIWFNDLGCFLFWKYYNFWKNSGRLLCRQRARNLRSVPASEKENQ